MYATHVVTEIVQNKREEILPVNICVRGWKYPGG